MAPEIGGGLLRPGPGVASRVWALEGGTLTFDASMLVLGAPPGPTVIPVPTFLVEHDHGLLLYDTGLATDAATDPERVYGALLPYLGLQFTEALRVDRQLEALGFSTSDVTHVVLSHAHYDHAGGLHLFPEATLFAGEPELPYAFWPISPAFSAHFRRADLDATRSYRWNTLTTDHDVFGDGSVRIVWTPGHTPGHLSLLARTPTGALLLTGDTVHLRSAWTGVLPGPADFSAEQAVRSIHRLRRLADAERAMVWVDHDPEDWVRFGGSGLIGVGR
jgi:glyoxylase-like metal-dependent hydrolase (beta-lactamase superfamily II)